MKVYSVTVHGREIEVTRNGDGTFSMPEDVAVFKRYNVSLKPAHEPIVLARKPLIGNVAANVLTHGTGALNIDGCRVAGAPRTTHARGNVIGDRVGASSYSVGEEGYEYQGASGRWPPNFCLSHHPDCDMDCHPDCPVKALGEMSGETVTRPHGGDGGTLDTRGQGWGFKRMACDLNDTGTAARYFPCFRYQAKSSTCERNLGMTLDKEAGNRVGRNSHPT